MQVFPVVDETQRFDARTNFLPGQVPPGLILDAVSAGSARWDGVVFLGCSSCKYAWRSSQVCPLSSLSRIVGLQNCVQVTPANTDHSGTHADRLQRFFPRPVPHRCFAAVENLSCLPDGEQIRE